jgi:DNA-binding NarL/FixJ family response regulator
VSVGESSVLVVDDDSMVRGWVRLTFQGTEFHVAGEASSVEEARQLLERRSARLLLIDYRLPDGMGTETLRALRSEGLGTPAVIMTANPERGFNEAARECGAHGTVLKTGNAEELLAALRAVAAGGESFDPRHPARAPGHGALSPREREIMRLVASGATNQEIAGELGIGSETVKTLLKRVFSKLGVRRRAEAVSVAHELGLL